MVLEVLRQGIVDVGEVHIAKSSLGRGRGERYVIYLPMSRNYLWKALHDLNIKVRVYIEVPEGTSEKVVWKKLAEA